MQIWTGSNGHTYISECFIWECCELRNADRILRSGCILGYDSLYSFSPPTPPHTQCCPPTHRSRSYSFIESMRFYIDSVDQVRNKHIKLGQILSSKEFGILHSEMLMLTNHSYHLNSGSNPCHTYDKAEKTGLQKEKDAANVQSSNNYFHLPLSLFFLSFFFLLLQVF